MATMMERRPRRAARWCLPALLGLAGTAWAAEVVPVRFIDGLPVVQVRLGAIRADFLLDTGGQLGITVPQPLINDASGVQLGTGQRKMGDAAGKVHTVQTLVATSLKLGAAELGPVDGLVNYKWGLQVGPGEAPAVTSKGAIGLGALASRNVLFDLSAGRLVLYDPSGAERPDLAGWRQVPFSYNKAGAVIQITARGATASMSLDSAATASMVSKDAALFKAMPSPCRGMPASAPFCGIKQLPQVQAGGGAIGPMALAVVQLQGVPFDGLLGIDFFQQHQVFLDFAARQLYLRPVPARRR